MKTTMAAALVVMLAGCEASALQQKPDPKLTEAQRNALRNPIGRFALAGKRDYPNGTEVYVLDTQSGQVCYYFVASGTATTPTAAKTDMQNCAGAALAPTL